MSDTDKEIDQDKGDEVLKRLLKTPPKPKIKDWPQNPPNESEDNEDDPLYAVR